jgi:hypothetical protein
MFSFINYFKHKTPIISEKMLFKLVPGRAGRAEGEACHAGHPDDAAPGDHFTKLSFARKVF